MAIFSQSQTCSFDKISVTDSDRLGKLGSNGWGFAHTVQSLLIYALGVVQLFHGPGYDAGFISMGLTEFID